MNDKLTKRVKEIVKDYKETFDALRKYDEGKINKELMEAGYLCPDCSIHNNELLKWEGDIRNMKCKKCGKITIAMCKINLAEGKTENPFPKPYYQHDHTHCFNGQEGHQNHLKCCLCTVDNPRRKTESFKGYLTEQLKDPELKAEYDKVELKKGESWRRGYMEGFEAGKKEERAKIYDQIVGKWADRSEITLKGIKKILCLK